MSGWLSRLFDTSAVPQDYTAPANQLGPLARQVMANPVGTETTSPYASQSVGVPSGPFNPIEAMTPNGPMLGTDLDRAHGALVTQGITEYAPTLLGMVGDAPGGKGFTAYHGSPHDFEAFDTSKIGTGEGAQAYGHGLYVAGAEPVAETYLGPNADWRLGNTKAQTMYDRLNNPALERGLDNDGWSKLNAQRGFWEKVVLGRSPRSIIDDAAANPDQYGPHELSYIQSLDPDKFKRTGGHMYEVNVNADPAHFLDWDRPLSEQHPVVQKAVAQAHDVATKAGQMYGQPPASATGADIYGGLRNTSGLDYDTLRNSNRAGADAAARALQQAGIPGIRYLDAGSRGVGSGTYNHVVFDANTLEILRKYGIAGLLGGTGAVAGTQQPSQ